MFCLCFPLGVLWCTVLHLGLQPILSLFLLTVLELSSFPSTIYWRDCLFSIVCFCCFCCWLIDHKCVSLFPNSLFCFADLCVCFCANTVLMTVIAKWLQSCPTLYDPIDNSPPGSPVPGILQARTLEWVAISFSNAWKWKVKVKLLSRVRL